MTEFVLGLGIGLIVGWAVCCLLVSMGDKREKEVEPQVFLPEEQPLPKKTRTMWGD